MTMPHLMNCCHDCSGWCLDCVKELWEEKEKLESTIKELEAKVEELRLSRDRLLAIEAQTDAIRVYEQNRIAELEAENQRLRLTQ